jgi:hypothetical protein
MATPCHTPMELIKTEESRRRGFSLKVRRNLTHMVIAFPQLCDFKNDCFDKSDEIDCGPCDFEGNNGCGWTDRSTGAYKVGQIITETQHHFNLQGCKGGGPFMGYP